MRKLLSLFAKLVFIANYVVGSIAFAYSLNRHDTGEWDSDGWMFMLSGGLIAGTMALLFEARLYRKLEFWPKILPLFLTRQASCGIVFMILSVVVAFSVTVVLDFPDTPAMFIVIPLMVAIYLPIIAPIGIVVGLINGILFRVVHTLQAQNKLRIS